MKKFYLVCICALLSVMGSAKVSIIPAPVKCVESKGNFVINANTKVVLQSDTEEMRNAVEPLVATVKDVAGYVLPTTTKGKSGIVCRIDAKIKNPEGYKLTVGKSGISIVAKQPQGVFYAIQTLRQLIYENNGKQVAKVQIPCVYVEDAPAYHYRGVMLDVSRHFLTKEEVMRQLDNMSLHKLNTFHWHLTDDQGWRIEIKRYPKLTKVGGYREKTIIGHASQKHYNWDCNVYGGFYTQEDIKEVVAYARKRFITVIPEIEMPGHSVAALAAYPKYSCSGGPFETEGRWGVFNDIYCTREETFQFLQDVLDEVVALFPAHYIHLGGDESPRIRWRNCVHCQKRMQEENLKSEAELQTYFMNRIARYLKSKDRDIIGWDEILEGGIPKGATVMSWRGEKGGIKAAKAGYNVIMSPNSHMYFNHRQYDKNVEKIGATHFLPLSRAYSYNPTPASLTPDEAKYILGVQANLWTEYLCTMAEMEYMLYPRVAALSEVAWTPKDAKNYDNFMLRLNDIQQVYDKVGIGACKITK